MNKIARVNGFFRIMKIGASISAILGCLLGWLVFYTHRIEKNRMVKDDCRMDCD